ncbi:MAG: hypothetical protein HONBIEJF_02832 [Fimbriimonadaceae bacterium]|nr:hypothetical protein [Fimbriimonadaceae bacterium]
MLNRTFCHLPGIGFETERKLWEQGCLTWADFLSDPSRYSVGSASKELVLKHIGDSQAALERREHQYFANNLKSLDVWRAWPEFRDRCVYLDIETDGGVQGEAITIIGLFDGNTFTCRVKERDLENFRDDISRFSMIVTFFGNGFDVPMLQKRFLGVHFDQLHLDLCPLLRRLGFRGGLKRIERELGFFRSPQTEGLNGRDAVRLWRQYLWTRNEAALDLLIAYNREDVVSLEKLADYAYKRLSREYYN